MKFIKQLTIIFMILLLSGCSTPTENIVNSETKKNEVIMESSATESLEEVGESESLASADSTEDIFETQSVESEKKDSLETISEMEIHFIDVGQGDSTLIKCGESAMLIDAAEGDKGTAIQLYLQKQGIEKLDYLILTHPDADHIGGAAVIIEKFPIGTVYMSAFTKDNRTYENLVNTLEYKYLKWTTPEIGSTFNLDVATITILGPAKSYDDPNNASIALLITHGENTFLFTGDAEEVAEKDMLNNGYSVDADVYHVGHHGSNTSSTKEFLEAVTPEYAVISCAEGNSYGHPHAEPLNNMRAMSVKIFRTDEQGSIIAVSDGNEINWNCTPSETWQTGVNISSNTQEEKAPVVGNNEEIKETTEEQSITYICNTNTKKFHYPTCASAKKISDKNRKEVYDSRDELIAQGYSPCGNCKP